MKNQVNKNPNRKKYIILSAGVGLLAIGGFSYWYFVGREKKPKTNEDDIIEKLTSEDAGSSKTAPKPPTPKPKISSPSPSSTGFPLKNNSKGVLVKNVQEALMQAYGKTILPAFGADGIFGKELTTALTSKGFPSIIDEAAYSKIIALNNPIIPNTPLPATVNENVDIAKNIWLNASNRKLEGLIQQLKRIKSVEQYVKVNELFKTVRLNGVRQTIVNASLSTFSDATSKQFISEALRQIGLKYYDEKWNLSGFFRRGIAKNQKNIRYV